MFTINDLKVNFINPNNQFIKSAYDKMFSAFDLDFILTDLLVEYSKVMTNTGKTIVVKSPNLVVAKDGYCHEAFLSIENEINSESSDMESIALIIKATGLSNEYREAKFTKNKISLLCNIDSSDSSLVIEKKDKKTTYTKSGDFFDEILLKQIDDFDF